MELDQNKILEKIAEEFESVCEYDLSNETKDRLSKDLEDFYQFALAELVNNFSKNECDAFIDWNPKNDETGNEISYFYKHLDYNRAIHAACNKYLGTTFF